MRKLVIELVTLQTTQTKPPFGSGFNILVARKLIEDFQYLTEISVIITKNMKIDEEFMAYFIASRKLCKMTLSNFS